MARSRIGVALLGAGFIAEYHLAGLAAAGGADVRLVVGRSRDKALDVARRFGVADVGTDVDAALGRPDVDAVVIATPDDTHEAIAVAAAQRGKAILLQKPMAGSVEAAERILAEARRQRVDLQVSFMHRFFDEVIAARELLREGVLGRVLSARIRNATPGPDWGAWFFSKEHVRNGVVDQLGVHGIDLVAHLLGPVRRASAQAFTAMPKRRLRGGTQVQVDVVDNAFATYELAAGTRVGHEISMTEAAGCDRFRMEIYGERGTLWLRSERGRLAVFAPQAFGQQWHVPPLPETPAGQRLHSAWLDGITGAAPPLATANDALHGMRVVEAIMTSSARSGVAVDVQ